MIDMAERFADLDGIHLRLDAKGILHMDLTRDLWWELEHSEEVWNTIEAWTDEPVCLCVCLDRVKGASSAGRSYHRERGIAGRTLALGLWGGGVVGRFVGNLFLRLNRPRYPTRLFSTEDEAMRYLISVRDGLPLSHDSGQTPQKG